MVITGVIYNDTVNDIVNVNVSDLLMLMLASNLVLVSLLLFLILRVIVINGTVG